MPSLRMSLLVFVGVSRAPFLLLTLSIVFLGACLSYFQVGSIPIYHLLLVATCGISAHITVNVFNEYNDFKSGLDLITVRTPFSGGSGVLPEHPLYASTVFSYGLTNLAVCLASGALLILYGGFELLFYGIAGIFIVLTYTPWLNRTPWLCLIAPGTAFGLIMIPGAVIALDGKANLATWIAAGAIFFLVNNLLLLNQLPDIEPDKASGRRTLPIVKSKNYCLVVASLFYLLAFSCVGMGVILSVLPRSTYFIFILTPLTVYSIFNVYKNDTTDKYVAGLAANVAINILFPVIFGVMIITSLPV